MGYHGRDDVTLTQTKVQRWSIAEAERLGLEEFRMYLTPTDDIRLALLVVPQEVRNRGRGAAAMRSLCRFADAHGKRIVLSPAEGGGAYGTTSRTRLVRFYARFGFREADGGELDATLLDAMTRAPQIAEVPHPSDRMDAETEMDLRKLA